MSILHPPDNKKISHYVIITAMERYLKSRYKIGEQISDNPFSATYRGSFIGTNKPVVIKIYKRGTLNSSLINRMKQKVRELTLISHHGIAKLLDGDYGWQGFYYVRDYVDGLSLERLLKEKKLDANRASTIAIEVCQALEPVHQRGIIHGGLKPSNVFIDKKGLVKVTDFIIEGEIKEALPQKPLHIIQDGKYASPEELAGNPATSASDIYAVGLLLLEMLSQGKLNLESSLAGSIKKVRPGSLLTRELIDGQPRYFYELLERALQRDPLLRYGSIADFRLSLENRALPARAANADEYFQIFESSVSRYGEEEINKESEELRDLGKVRLRWGQEKHRRLILAVILLLAAAAGLVYAFFFGQ